MAKRKHLTELEREVLCEQSGQTSSLRHRGDSYLIQKLLLSMDPEERFSYLQGEITILLEEHGSEKTVCDLMKFLISCVEEDIEWSERETLDYYLEWYCTLGQGSRSYRDARDVILRIVGIYWVEGSDLHIKEYAFYFLLYAAYPIPRGVDTSPVLFRSDEVSEIAWRLRGANGHSRVVHEIFRGAPLVDRERFRWIGKEEIPDTCVQILFQEWMNTADPDHVKTLALSAELLPVLSGVSQSVREAVRALLLEREDQLKMVADADRVLQDIVTPLRSFHPSSYYSAEDDPEFDPGCIAIEWRSLKEVWVNIELNNRIEDPDPVISGVRAKLEAWAEAYPEIDIHCTASGRAQDSVWVFSR